MPENATNVSHAVWECSPLCFMVWEWREGADGDDDDFWLLAQNPEAIRATKGVFTLGCGLVHQWPEHLEIFPELGCSLYDWYLRVIQQQVILKADFFFSDARDGILTGDWRNKSIPLGDNKLCMIFEDRSEDVAKERQLEQLAMTDQMLGIYNRHWLEDAMARDLSDRDGPKYSFLFIDLDKFKRVNDTYGHAAGDALLIEIVKRIKSALRPGDALARLGGDEFGVWLRGVGVDQAALVADRISDAVAQSWHYEGVALNPSASIGIADTSMTTAWDDLLRLADQGMYKSKQEKLRFCVVDDAQQRRSVMESALARDIPRALQNGEFVLHYQRIVRLNNATPSAMKTVGYEALARWQHPERGILYPGAFIDVVRSTGAMPAFTHWVASQVVSDRERLGCDCYMAINVCPTLSPEQILALPRTQGMGIELTEQAIERKGVYESLGVVQRTGVKILLDDLGTEGATLTRAASFGWDAVKIDRSFLQQAHLLPGLVALIHSIGAKSVLEGIEPEMGDVLEKAITAGVDYGQGWMWGKAEPLDASRE